ncbi:MAG: HAMP domain-containing sensor histidine kinase [Planctomycetota bacterium]
MCNEWVERISDGMQDVSSILLAHADRNYRTSRTVTDLEDLLSRAIDASETELKEWGIETSIDVSSTENVRLPKNVMVPVLSNLVKNAAQVMFNHFTFKPTINLRVRRLNPQLLTIEVEDNGPGVPESQRERIFERGLTTKLKGQGVGLAFCKQAITEIGGRIEVDSPAEHMGTIFRVTIPVS